MHKVALSLQHVVIKPHDDHDRRHDRHGVDEENVNQEQRDHQDHDQRSAAAQPEVEYLLAVYDLRTCVYPAAEGDHKSQQRAACDDRRVDEPHHAARRL